MLVSRTLGDISESVDYGVTASAANDAVGPKFLRITDIQDGRVNWAHVPYCECDPRSAQASLLRSGDIVFARTGATTGKSFLIAECPTDAVFASYLIRVRFADGVEPRYVNHYFQSPGYWAQISRGARGAAQPGVNATTLKSLQIPLPSLDDQKRIAHLLGKVEGLIAQRKQHLQQLDALLKSVFLEMFGDPVKNEKGWEKRRCEDVCDILSGYAFKSAEYSDDKSQNRLCGGLIVMPGYIDWSKCNYWPERKDVNVDKFRLSRNDIVIAMDRPWISSGFKISLIDDIGVDSLLVQRAARVRAQTSNQLFVYFNLNSEQFKAHCRPTETTIPHISIKEIESFPLIIPPIPLQNRFAAIVEKVEGIKSRYQQSLADLETLYGALSQKAFAGELDLSRVVI